MIGADGRQETDDARNLGSHGPELLGLGTHQDYVRTILNGGGKAAEWISFGADLRVDEPAKGLGAAQP
jgi:hypothetical protein